MKRTKVLTAMMLVTLSTTMLFGCGGNDSTKETSESSTEIQTTAEIQTEETTETAETTAETSTEAETETTEVETTAEISSEKFVEDVKATVDGQLGEDEAIKDVVFENNELCVYVDFSNTDPGFLTLEELALSRTSSLTDAILELSQYDNLWDTITVDFGSLGKVENTKEDLRENEFGGRYFAIENFTLE